MNGFGKTAGLMQVDELGQLETPIVLTNTLSVGTCIQGLVAWMIADNPEIGRTTGTVNPVVAECNDGRLNDIQRSPINADDVSTALLHCSKDFGRGAVGAGRGMVCFGLKGGIGSASRVIHLDGIAYTIGVLVLTNFGSPGHLVIRGQPFCPDKLSSENRDQGSVIVVVGTDLPVSSRQLKRIVKRTAVGIARTGSYVGNGSGDVAIGFSTANVIPHSPSQSTVVFTMLHEDALEDVFASTADATEAAIIDSLMSAVTVTGRDGYTVSCLRDIVPHA